MSEAWPLSTFLVLAALPTAVACARLHTKQVLWEWGLEQLVDDAQILVSELMSNAVKASCPGNWKGLIALRLFADHEQVLIEVWDQSPGEPMPRALDDESESGRGFAVIEDLSHEWGYRRISAGLKVVWCEMVIKSA